MRILAGVTPMAVGTAEAESFHSVLQRTALAHNVAFTRLLSFLSNVGRASAEVPPKGDELISVLGGTGDRCRDLVEIYEELSGKRGFKNHTFLPLASVISPRAQNIFITRQRWCPTCVHPDKGIGYGLLAHTLRGVNHCTLHRTALEWCCQNCHYQQTYTATLFARPVCGRCRAPLWRKARPWIPSTGYDDWAERQLGDLVAYLTNPERPRPSEHWMDETRTTISQLSKHLTCGLRGRELTKAMLVRKAPKQGFQLPTLLWLAAYHSTTLVEVILRPNEAMSSAFPHLAHIRRGTSQRQTYANARLVLLRAVVSDLLASATEVWLPALDTISALVGCGRLWGKNPDLARRYNQQRSHYARAGISVTCDRLFVEMILERRSDLVPRFALDQILARKKKHIPDEVRARVVKAVKRVDAVMGPMVFVTANPPGSPKLLSGSTEEPGKANYSD